MRRFEADHNRSYFEYHATRIELTAGDAAAARRHAEEAVSLARRAEFPARLAQALCMLGQVTVRTDPRTARAALDEISTIEQSSAFLAGQGMYNPLFVKVRLCQAEQDSRSALDALHDAAARARERGVFTAITAVALLAGMLVDLDQPRIAALLGGVLTRGPYAAYFLLVTAPEDRHELDDQLAVVRARLGDDEYEQAIAHGAGMSLDGVIDTMVTAIDEAFAKLPSGTDSR